MSVLENIQGYWAIILFVGGVIASWARYELKLNSLESRMKENHVENAKEIEKLDLRTENNIKSLDIFREGIGKNIQEIQTTMKFILESINEIKKK